ncbi:MAG: peptidoglycan recognition protein family protein [Bacilli bacterium]
MGFLKKYPILHSYLPRGSKRRSGQKINKVLFIVAHDTGNDSSTAKNNVDYYKRSCNEMYASAHLFVDDKEIIECIPAVLGTEKAWHVLYDRTLDNKRYGDDANDAAIGVELCYSTKGNINNELAYKRYVWTIAYLCYLYRLNPAVHIIGHHQIDPERKTDPMNAFSKMKKTWAAFIDDVEDEYKKCLKTK